VNCLVIYSYRLKRLSIPRYPLRLFSYNSIMARSFVHLSSIAQFQYTRT